jgi:ribosomal protein S18 acetylase RimI-like enzyme
MAYSDPMRWLRSSRDAGLVARQATASDRPAVSALLSNAWWRHGAPALEDLVALLHGGASTVALARGQCIGWLGLSAREPAGDPLERWADVASVAIAGGRAPAKVVQALMDAAIGGLNARGVTGLVCLTSENWLREALSEARFLELDQVISYARAGRMSLPQATPGPARLRSVCSSEGEVVLALNSAAFAPIWRYDSSTILSWLLTADHAVLAETAAGPAGFAMTTRSQDSEFAQLIRIAVAPQFQHRGIGLQVLVDAIHYAWETGAAGLSLNTQTSNTISRHLYEGLGFRLTGQTVSVLVRAL